MFVSQSMSSKVITIGPEASLSEATALLEKNRIRHLPVVGDDGRLVGIVTDRDLRSAAACGLPSRSGSRTEPLAASIVIKDIMTASPQTISTMDTIPDALLLIQRLKVGALPVLDEKGELRGIISVRDLLRAFINVLGVGEPGTLLGILVEEKIGQMKKIVDAITEENISIGSILVARYWEKDKRAVFPYLLTQNVARIKQKLETLGFTILDPMKWWLDQLP